ncbi:hypothetical protein H0A36_18760 [Endozoicomonas sp. SM1973]|uniref:Uncharacterized protein n=1 Tax=Spartinivicinus marinus TaxID=2994442 RepID=A0A853I288_9GAMM|nr:hypothetical protein [Spartinivicinus marinus]MCX4029729.1 hypothetical protein [Spartinivicinus marinus]NYZ68060.1 hypothetical protein [Spartinivicinus marinus]
MIKTKNGECCVEYALTRWLVVLLCFSSVNALGAEYIADNAQLSWLGLGLDSRSGFNKQACVKGSWKKTGDTRVELQYLGSRHTRDAMEQVFGKIKGGVNVVIFSGSVSVSMTSRISENQTTAASTIKLTYNGPNYTLENRTLTPLGQTMTKADPATVLGHCGDEFIYHMDTGGEVYVTAKLHFRSKEAYKKFVTKVKVRVLFVKKTKTYTKEWYHYAEDAVYSINVVTNGGETPKLKRILKENPRYCKTADIDDCFNTASLLFEYLFGDNGYHQDLTATALKVLSFDTQRYDDSGHFALNPKVAPYIDPGFKIQEEKIKIKLIENNGYQQSLQAFYAVADGSEHKQYYENELTKVQHNLTTLNKAATACQVEAHFVECKGVVDQAMNSLYNISIKNASL